MTDVITVMNLGWQYAPLVQEGTSIPCLRNVNCYVPQGDMVGIIGPTGSGKTTFTKILTGVAPHLTAGTITGFVRIAGMNMKTTSVSNLSRQIGYVSQNPIAQLFCTTVEQEIAFTLENRGVPVDQMRERVNRMLNMLHIEGIRHRDPRTLSVGEAERVAIASVLVAEPEVLILDEVTAPLDTEGKNTLFNVLDTMRKEHPMTVIMVDQDTTSMARWADSIFLMVGGEIIRRTTPVIFTRERALLESVGVTPPDADDTAPLALAADQRAHIQDPVISLDHVTVNYRDADPDQPPALDDVSLQLERGAFIGVTGANGSGKSTLANLLNGVIKPNSGTVTVDGKTMGHKSVGRRSRFVGVVEQNPDQQIICGSVRDEIAYGPRKLHLSDSEVRARVEEMVALFDLYPLEDVDPKTLSYGEKRAVSLASVLAMKTPVLVLDEPMAGLDRRLSSRLLGLLSRLNHDGVTVIMMSNDAQSIASYCTYLVRLDHGHVVDAGPILRQEPQPVQPTSIEEPVSTDQNRQHAKKSGRTSRSSSGRTRRTRKGGR